MKLCVSLEALTPKMRKGNKEIRKFDRRDRRDRKCARQIVEMGFKSCIRETNALVSVALARKPVLASCLLAVKGPVCSSDECCTTQQRASAEERSTEPTVGENCCSDGTADQDSECAAEHVEAKSASNGAHVRRHRRNAGTLKGDKGTGAESVK